MGQDSLYKEKAGELVDQRVHALTSTQELRQLPRTYVKLSGGYLGEESPICLSMGTWPCHIDHFERQYDKAFTRNPLLWEDLMDRIHRILQHDHHKGCGVRGSN